MPGCANMWVWMLITHNVSVSACCARMAQPRAIVLRPTGAVWRMLGHIWLDTFCLVNCHPCHSWSLSSWSEHTSSARLMGLWFFFFSPPAASKGKGSRRFVMGEIVKMVENKQNKHWKLRVATCQWVRDAKSGAFSSPGSIPPTLSRLTSMPTSDWGEKG